MKVLVTGCTGQLGYDVVKELQKRNIECIGAVRADFDLADAVLTRDFIAKYHPDAVIHCAAYTAVDKAQEESQLCRQVNVGGAQNVARACQAIAAKMIYISTDYVFPGTGEDFYEVDAPPKPLGVYGQTKLDGELAVKSLLEKYFIVRISWVFGKNGNNFVQTMLRLGKDRAELNVVADQFGSPTYTPDLAKLLCDMVVTERYGTYHATNEGVCSWAEFAKEIFSQAGIPVRVCSIPASAYPTKAVRPQNSRLSKASLTQNGFDRLPKWPDALQRFLQELGS